MFNGEIFDGRQPHTPGLGQLRIAFDPGAQWINALPAGTDATGFAMLQFRAAVDFEGPTQGAGGVEITVVLTDGSGATASVSVSDYTDALGPPTGTLTPILPKKQLNGIRLPLADFEGVDLADLASVTLSFEGGAGGLLLSDLAFSDAVEVDDPTGTGGTGDTGDADSTGDAPGLDESGGDAPPETTGGTTGLETDAGTGGGDAAQMEGDDGCGCTQRGQGNGPSSWLLLALAGLGLRRRD